MGISDIFKYVDKYGVGGVVLIILFLLILTIFKADWFSNLINKLVNNFFKKRNIDEELKNITESDILNHDIIKFIDFWIYSKVPTFKFSTDYRTSVFRKYIELYLKGYKKNINEFIKSGKFKEMDDAQIWKHSLSLINNTIYEYESEMRRNGIPDVIIEKMKIKNNDTLSLTIDLIEGICNSRFYGSKNNLLKVYSILNILLSILENTISHSDFVCNSINGELKGLEFDGHVEP
jgi:hypothetical protein